MRPLLAGLTDSGSVGEAIVRRLRNRLPATPGPLCGFVPFAHEPDIRGFLRHWLELGGELLLPRHVREKRDYELVAVRSLERDLEAGHYGIAEPLASLPAVEPVTDPVWLVPGLCFSLDGRRLGHGKGYYDRMLGRWPGVTYGIARECQLVLDIPCVEHDISVDYLVTELRFIECRPLPGCGQMNLKG